MSGSNCMKRLPVANSVDQVRYHIQWHLDWICKVCIYVPEQISSLKRGKVNFFNPIALRKAKTVYNVGLPECNRVKVFGYTSEFFCHI